MNDNIRRCDERDTLDDIMIVLGKSFIVNESPCVGLVECILKTRIFYLKYYIGRMTVNTRLYLLF